MPVLYNGSGLVPAPFVSINKSSIRGPGNTITGQDYTITLNGTIVNTDGTGNNNLDSPGSSGTTDTRMSGTQGGQNYIRRIFSTDGGLLEIYSPESQTNKFSAYCNVESITFDQGNWVQKNNYTVTLRAKYTDNNDILNQLEDIQESWETQEVEDETTVLTHKIQAKGRLLKIGGTYNVPLNIAKQWVYSRSYQLNTGAFLENVSGSGIMVDGLSYYQLTHFDSSNYWVNRISSDFTNPIDYTYGLTETFLWLTGPNNEQYNVTVNLEQDWPHRATISVAGTIIGVSNAAYENTERLANASGYYGSQVEPNLYLRANAYKPAGYTVYPNFISKQVSYDIIPGNIRYSATFVAMNGTPLVSGAIDESIQISDVGTTDLVAVIPVPGRSSGPIIQWMNTKTAPERQVTINATLGASGNVSLSNLLTSYLAKPNTDALITALKPSAGYYYVKGDTEEWNPIKRNYSRSVSWLIDQPSGVSITGIPYSSGLYYTG